MLSIEPEPGANTIEGRTEIRRETNSCWHHSIQTHTLESSTTASSILLKEFGWSVLFCITEGLLNGKEIILEAEETLKELM